MTYATIDIFLLWEVRDQQRGRVWGPLRLGAVYGSRIKGNYERLTHALARNRFIPIGNGLNRRTLIYDKLLSPKTLRKFTFFDGQEITPSCCVS